MATFKYSAFDSSEKNTSGFINATDLEEASSRSVAFINPEVFFSLESNALYLNVAINLP